MPRRGWRPTTLLRLCACVPVGKISPSQAIMAGILRSDARDGEESRRETEHQLLILAIDEIPPKQSAFRTIGPTSFIQRTSHIQRIDSLRISLPRHLLARRFAGRQGRDSDAAGK